MLLHHRTRMLIRKIDDRSDKRLRPGYLALGNGLPEALALLSLALLLGPPELVPEFFGELRHGISSRAIDRPRLAVAQILVGIHEQYKALIQPEQRFDSFLIGASRGNRRDQDREP